MRVLGRGEVKAAVPALVKAFWTYSETVHLLPDERRRRHVLPRYLASDANDAARFGTLLGEERDGQIIGAAAWVPPEAYPVPIGRQVRQIIDLAPTLPWAWRCVREAQRGQTGNRAYHVRHPAHYYLRVIGVDPAAQAHGIGSSLVRPVLQMADDRGVGCFLQTATAENVSWYERFGFTVAATYQPTPTWPQVWAMWRDPVSG